MSILDVVGKEEVLPDSMQSPCSSKWVVSDNGRRFRCVRCLYAPACTSSWYSVERLEAHIFAAHFDYYPFVPVACSTGRPLSKFASAAAVPRQTDKILYCYDGARETASTDVFISSVCNGDLDWRAEIQQSEQRLYQDSLAQNTYSSSKLLERTHRGQIRNSDVNGCAAFRLRNTHSPRIIRQQLLTQTEPADLEPAEMEERVRRCLYATVGRREFVHVHTTERRQRKERRRVQPSWNMGREGSPEELRRWRVDRQERMSAKMDDCFFAGVIGGEGSSEAENLQARIETIRKFDRFLRAALPVGGLPRGGPEPNLSGASCSALDKEPVPSCSQRKKLQLGDRQAVLLHFLVTIGNWQRKTVANRVSGYSLAKIQEATASVCDLEPASVELRAALQLAARDALFYDLAFADQVGDYFLSYSKHHPMLRRPCSDAGLQEMLSRRISLQQAVMKEAAARVRWFDTVSETAPWDLDARRCSHCARPTVFVELHALPVRWRCRVFPCRRVFTQMPD